MPRPALLRGPAVTPCLGMVLSVAVTVFTRQVICTRGAAVDVIGYWSREATGGYRGRIARRHCSPYQVRKARDGGDDLRSPPCQPGDESPFRGDAGGIQRRCRDSTIALMCETRGGRLCGWPRAQASVTVTSRGSCSAAVLCIPAYPACRARRTRRRARATVDGCPPRALGRRRGRR